MFQEKYSDLQERKQTENTKTYFEKREKSLSIRILFALLPFALRIAPLSLLALQFLPHHPEYRAKILVQGQLVFVPIRLVLLQHRLHVKLQGVGTEMARSLRIERDSQEAEPRISGGIEDAASEGWDDRVDGGGS